MGQGWSAKSVVLVLAASLGAPAAASAGSGVLRPGSAITIDASSSACTANFQFTDGEELYAGTAGHCGHVNDPRDDHPDVAEVVYPRGEGKRVALRDGDVPLGEMVYAGMYLPTFHGADQIPFGMDFALFRLDPGAVADPRVCLFGGPTRLARDVPPVATVVHYYGAGAEFAERAPGRTGIVRTVQSADYLTGLAPFGTGDSGAPVIDGAGRAVGTLTAWVTRLEPVLRRIRERTGLRLRLLRAPFTAPASLTGTDQDCS